MSNTCDFGTMKRPTGWIAWYRLHHYSSNRVVRDGRKDIIFGTQAEAEAEAKKEFFKHMNSPIVSQSMTGPTSKKALAKATADAQFKGLKPFVKAKGSQRRTVVERVGERA